MSEPVRLIEGHRCPLIAAVVRASLVAFPLNRRRRFRVVRLSKLRATQMATCTRIANLPQGSLQDFMDITLGHLRLFSINMSF
ncbi:hypothetical protein JNB91_28790 [Rhizobium wenxiniae]|uniref:hypothetical protein n=1 Tax=Rhizobium wenxiniae TaxID=1737357 RepID=UPI001C6E841A|nr:hypothetical protein [Rhizobium wenxiniae]MBW9091782.1 hypothetical protein [Rhizobium wenxiniae]